MFIRNEARNPTTVSWVALNFGDQIMTARPPYRYEVRSPPCPFHGAETRMGHTKHSTLTNMMFWLQKEPLFQIMFLSVKYQESRNGIWPSGTFQTVGRISIVSVPFITILQISLSRIAKKGMQWVTRRLWGMVMVVGGCATDFRMENAAYHKA